MTKSGGNQRARHNPIFEALEDRLLLDAVRIPWVSGVTTSSVYVCLEATNNTQNAVVDYGLTGSYGSQLTTEYSQPTDYGYYVHNVKLTGLSPNTEYHYRITHGSSVSSDYTFTTAPLPGTNLTWGFAADCRSDTYIGDVSRHDNMASLIASHDPKMMVYGGDLVYGAYWPSWNKEWLTTNQATLNATTPWVNAVGNHEAWFNNLTQGFTQSPDGDDYCFSFDYGDTHILVLSNINSSTMPYGPGSAQWNFAAADLAASTAAWKIVAFHRPAYAWGSHGGEALTQQMTTEIFEPNGVNIILSGHDHFYQHNLVNDIHHMVIGTFGVSPSTPSSSPTYTVHTEASLCFGMFDITPTSLTLTTYRENGSVIETINLSKDTTPPTAPTYLSAMAVNDDRIDLAWMAASDPQSGIDHYKIYRNSNLVGTTNQITYSDTGLNEQTFYLYQVSAVNGEGLEGAKSDSAFAMTPADTTAPTIASASWVSALEVNVLFSEEVEETSAENIGNYAIYSSDQYVHVFSATRQADGKTVSLSVSELSETRTYTVSVSNVRDLATTPHTIAPNSQVTFAFTGWPSQDVGGPLATGSSSYSAGTYTILADGTDIYGSSDQFHYVYHTLDGDGEIIARVVSVPTSGDMWCAKGGVMMRDNMNGNSPEVSMVVAGGGVTATWFQRRSTTGGSTSATSGPAVDAPYWVRLVRDNGLFYGYVSSTGQAGTWTQVVSGASVADMTSGTIYVGLCASSHASGLLGTFVMDNVQVIDYDAPANVAPVGTADSYFMTWNSTMNVVPGSGVLINDSDANSDSLSAAIVGDVSNGLLTLNGNGSFDYEPDADFAGTDSFTYRAGDGALTSGVTTVSIRVAIPGDANLDDTVNLSDFTLLKSNFGLAGAWGDGDFNDDGTVNLSDFTILKANFGLSGSAGSGQGASEAETVEASASTADDGKAPKDRRSALPMQARGNSASNSSRRKNDNAKAPKVDLNSILVDILAEAKAI